MSPEFVRAQKNMQPGEITADGFLGDDRRTLLEIIAADEAEMSSIGLSFDDSAARLDLLMEAGRKGLGEPLTVEGRWRVKTDEARGVLPSPFEDGVFRKVNATIVLTSDPSVVLRITALSMHLMRVHHFLQGKGAPFRIEPQILKRIFDV